MWNSTELMEFMENVENSGILFYIVFEYFSTLLVDNKFSTNSVEFRIPLNLWNSWKMWFHYSGILFVECTFSTNSVEFRFPQNLQLMENPSICGILFFVEFVEFLNC